MLVRQSDRFIPPHRHDSELVTRYLEWLMAMTHKHPHLMQVAVYFSAASFISLTYSSASLPILGIESSTRNTVLATSGGVVGSILSLAHGVVQHKIFGMPLPAGSSPLYQNSSFNYKTAKGTLVVEDNHMPILKIEADDPFDAGYVEGWLLAPAIEAALEKIEPLYSFIWKLINAPKDNAYLGRYLRGFLDQILTRHQLEMHGKMQAFNERLRLKGKKQKPFLFEFYSLLQSLPEFHNYHPFKDQVASTLVTGCTTAAIRLNNYTAFLRVLDWPSYGGSDLFLQVERKIGDTKRTIDIGMPLTSSALTMLNEDGLLVQINVATMHDENVLRGMPSTFLMRYAAEELSSVEELTDFVKKVPALGAFHLTASDGRQTKSFHIYQSQEVRYDHAIDTLGEDKQSPQLLVVANHGVEWKKGKSQVINYKDSNERKINIETFFNQPKLQEQFHVLIEKQNEKDLSAKDHLEIQKFCIDVLLRIGRLDLIDNCESVVCAAIVFDRHQVVKAYVSTNNGYAPSREFKDFQQISHFGSEGHRETKEAISSASLGRSIEEVVSPPVSKPMISSFVAKAGVVGAGAALATGINPLLGLLWTGLFAKTAEVVASRTTCKRDHKPPH